MDDGAITSTDATAGNLDLLGTKVGSLHNAGLFDSLDSDVGGIWARWNYRCFDHLHWFYSLLDC